MVSKHDAKYWIEKLRLEAHPEGGYFRQTYRAEMMIAREALAGGLYGSAGGVDSDLLSAGGENFSAFHRLRSDEVWHFYAGSPLVVDVIDAIGESILRFSWERSGGGAGFSGCRAWRDAGSLRTWRTGNRLRWWVARWRRDLILRILRWGSGRSWCGTYPQHREVIERLTRG